MPALLGIKRTDTYQSMNTSLSFQIPKGIGSGYLDGRTLDTTLILLKIKNLAFKTTTLAISEVHAHQHIGPVTGFCSARSCMNGEKAVILIELTIKQGLDP